MSQAASKPVVKLPPAAERVGGAAAAATAVPASAPESAAGSEDFLSRWSRRKREVRAGAVLPDARPAAAAPVLPSLETLAAQGLEGDFSAFMQAGVEEGLRRAAIQQLFKQPVFNVMDGLDVYIEDFNVYEPLTAAELPGLAHARGILFPAFAAETADAATTDAAASAQLAAEVATEDGAEAGAAVDAPSTLAEDGEVRA